VLFHAGAIYRAAGEDARALEYLRAVSEQSPRFSVRYAGEAEQALAELEALARAE
jgi:hypothetical protein